MFENRAESARIEFAMLVHAHHPMHVVLEGGDTDPAIL
jgi:hypothetical protein